MKKLHEIKVVSYVSPSIMCAEAVQDEPAFRAKELSKGHPI